MLYRLKSISATQFDSKLPSHRWPGGVTASAASPTGYLFNGIGGEQPISPGDYVMVLPEQIVARLIPQAEFERAYEIVQ